MCTWNARRADGRGALHAARRAAIAARVTLILSNVTAPICSMAKLQQEMCSPAARFLRSFVTKLGLQLPGFGEACPPAAERFEPQTADFIGP